jgi:hypothetical protein
LNEPTRARTSSTERPLIAALIIEADDWLIEQPCPSMATSVTTPSSTAR